jgi:F-type H+-transporting ATPase subunit delta
MKDGVVALRYARALFQAAPKGGGEAKVGQDLKRFTHALRTDDALSAALRHPLLSPAEKGRRVRAALGKGAAPAVERFLALALAKKRLALVPYIASLFDDLADEAAGVRRVQVKSALPLAAEQVKDLEARLGRAWGCRVAAEASVDESLLGGLVVRQGDRVWDRSLRGQLRQLKERFMEASKL